MKTTLVLNDDVAREAKRRAAQLRISMSEFTERALRDALAEKTVSTRRIVLPTAGGDLPRYAHSLAELKMLAVDDEPR